MEKPKEIEFNGITYRLMGSKKYYLSQSTHNEGRRHAKGLHVAVWEFYSGKSVPKGYCIHHKDGNTFNNDFSNLICEPIQKHLSDHGKKNFQDSDFRKLALDNLRKSKQKAAEWHHSNEGMAWHKEHAKTLKKIWDFQEDRICAVCGKHYVAMHPRSMYCCNACAQKAARKRNTQQRICAYCGKPFVGYRNCCSQKCAKAFKDTSK